MEEAPQLSVFATRLLKAGKLDFSGLGERPVADAVDAVHAHALRGPALHVLVAPVVGALEEQVPCFLFVRGASALACR